MYSYLHENQKEDGLKKCGSHREGVSIILVALRYGLLRAPAQGVIYQGDAEGTQGESETQLQRSDRYAVQPAGAKIR